MSPVKFDAERRGDAARVLQRQGRLGGHPPAAEGGAPEAHQPRRGPHAPREGEALVNRIAENVAILCQTLLNVAQILPKFCQNSPK